MSKKIIKLLIIIIFILLLAALVFCLVKYFEAKKDSGGSKIDTAAVETMNKDEERALGLNHLGIFEVISRDAAGKVASYRLIGLEEEQPINLELMSDEEKLQRHLATSTKIQVLERDSSGAIVSYKIINNDSDILQKY